ncbi:terpenoid synthase [Obba rivulosa]|uniref:Terpenoid synthase n=1 Tax=Obba rivulosa TaxID=1052685 RepID=A0A8E2AQ68_9APHY|nr:terpenoid synthase [Obba rivulosa]
MVLLPEISYAPADCIARTEAQFACKLPTPTNRQSTIDVARLTIRECFSKLNIVLPSYPRDAELESRVYAAVQTWDDSALALRYVPTALAFITTAYAHLSSIDLKIQLALFVVLATALDEPAIMHALPSQDFHARFCAGSVGMENDMLGQLVGVLEKMPEFYSRYAAAAIGAAALQFVNVSILENESRDVRLHADARAFVEYRRVRSSVAEAYAHFVWEKARFPDVHAYVQAIPDAILFIGYLNDILSFYKEELEGEVGNYVGDRALVSGKSSLETLREIIDEAAAASDRIHKILGDGEARDAWDAFVTGGIAFHVIDPRYRLQEVLGTQYR